MNISIVGTGYVGLVSGVCLAEKGHHVTCVDIDEEKVAMINRGESPIFEKGLDDLLNANLGIKFRATMNLREAILNSDITMIAVGTPFDGEEIDLHYIRETAAQIGTVLLDKAGYHVVVVKSTVIPGTTDDVVRPLLEEYSGKKVGKDIGVVMNPEFLREGEAIQDFLYPDRIVIGGNDERALEVMKKLYMPFEGVDQLPTNARTAETIKYTANSLLATMISFSNEIGNLCSEIGGVDVVDVMRGVHLDQRLSPILEGVGRITPGFTTYLKAGCGFGGSCFPKDVKALSSYGKKAGSPMRVLDSVIAVNQDQPLRIVTLLRHHFPDLSGVKVVVLGLAFKPGTDDMRESPAIPIVEELLTENARVKAYDPVAQNEATKMFGNTRLTFADSLEDAVASADALLLLTWWPEFKILPDLISSLENPPLLIDGRRMVGKYTVPRYEGIGLSNAAN